MRCCVKKRCSEYADLFKALSDPNRLIIIDMLSQGELCACVILARLQISQPTLSHHMKTLCESGIVRGRRAGKWMYYTLNEKTLRYSQIYLNELIEEINR